MCIANMNQDGDDDDETKLAEIEARWNDKMYRVCPSCMYECVRHWDRNERCMKDDDNDDTPHPERHDGTIYAEAGADIGALLEIIKRLKRLNEK